jgi:hypothetical protein
MSAAHEHNVTAEQTGHGLMANSVHRTLSQSSSVRRSLRCRPSYRKLGKRKPFAPRARAKMTTPMPPKASMGTSNHE